LYTLLVKKLVENNSCMCVIICRDTQTYITGDQIIINDSRENLLNPGESVNSLLKMHKLEKKLIQCNQELALTKTHLCSIHTSYEKLKVRFHKLHADYHKLINVAGELTVALENSVKGQTVDIQRTLEICMKIFPDLFNQNIRETSYVSIKKSQRVFHKLCIFNFANIFDSHPCCNSVILT